MTKNKRNHLFSHCLSYSVEEISAEEFLAVVNQQSLVQQEKTYLKELENKVKQYQKAALSK